MADAAASATVEEGDHLPAAAQPADWRSDPQVQEYLRREAQRMAQQSISRKEAQRQAALREAEAARMHQERKEILKNVKAGDWDAKDTVVNEWVQAQELEQMWPEVSQHFTQRAVAQVVANGWQQMKAHETFKDVPPEVWTEAEQDDLFSGAVARLVAAKTATLERTFQERLKTETEAARLAERDKLRGRMPNPDLVADGSGAMTKKTSGFTPQEVADPAFYAAHRDEIKRWYATLPRR